MRFTDVRFSYSRLGLGSDDKPVLAGWVCVGENGRIEEEVMNGRVQR